MMDTAAVAVVSILFVCGVHALERPFLFLFFHAPTFLFPVHVRTNFKKKKK